MEDPINYKHANKFMRPGISSVLFAVLKMVSQFQLEPTQESLCLSLPFLSRNLLPPLLDLLSSRFSCLFRRFPLLFRFFSGGVESGHLFCSRRIICRERVMTHTEIANLCIWIEVYVFDYISS